MQEEKKRNDRENARVLKEIIREIHDGADPARVKTRFERELKGVTPTDIGRAEEELIKEGLPRQEIRRLCDVHLEVMRDALDKQPVEVTPGHPVHTFREEHSRIQQFLEILQKTGQTLKQNPTLEMIKEKLPLLEHIAEHLMEVEQHNAREENVLFPYLEKYGITEPPAVMWAEHDELRALKKRLVELVQAHDNLSPSEFVGQLQEVADPLNRMLSSHIFKENNILYPMALQAIPAQDWEEIRRQCDELGYCCFTPEQTKAPASEEGPAETPAAQVAPDDEVSVEAKPDGRITFPTGQLSQEELTGVLNALPVEITFVDKDDTFRYFNETKERIFIRTKARIGHKVQGCHPQKSIDQVEEILEAFRKGLSDSAHFWIHTGDKYAHISYYAVRNEQGEYLGCLETIQDINPLKAIEGEKRLL